MKKNRQALINQCSRIKFLLEQLSGIDNIGIHSRKGALPDMKKMYCKLCSENTTASLSVIAEVLGNDYSHTSVLSAIRTFEVLYSNHQLRNEQLYNAVQSAFLELEQLDFSDEMKPFLNDMLIDFLNWYLKISKRKKTTIQTYVTQYLQNGK